MELRWQNKTTKAIGVAFVAADDKKILKAVGYFHCKTEDVPDDELDGALVEIWKPLYLKNC